MSNLWTDQVVVFHPLFNKDNSLQGFAIVSKNHKVFYTKEANYKTLLSEAKSVIVFDGYSIKKVIPDFEYTQHNLRTLYYQINSSVRFQTVKDLIKQEFYTNDVSTYSYMGNSERTPEAKQCILEASFIREFYLKNYKKVDKSILKIDNSLLEKLSLKENKILLDQVAIRTQLSTYQLEQWNTEREIFKIVGHPVISINQLPIKQQTSKLKDLFEHKNKCKSKYESLVRYLDIESLDLELDVTGSSTGRIFCRGRDLGLFAPDKEYKQNFLAIEGYTFISADYSKQEATIIACVSNDNKLQKDLQHKNYYAKLAKLLIGKENKQIGKDLFYALLYGVSAKVLASKLNIEEIEAKNVRRKLQARYSAVTNWLNKASTLKANYFGRKLYESTANAYIQSTAADIVRMKLLETIEYDPVCVFSDNIIYCVPDQIVNKCKNEIQTILESINPFKLKVEIGCSKNFNFS